MKKAMSMIELVFAIVIMGIVVMSLPLVLSQTQNSNSFALRQEVILSIKTKLSYILSYQWDQYTYDSTADIERVLTIPASADTATDFNTSTIRRKGHVLADGRRRLWDDLNVSTTKATFTTDTANDDIDDFNGKSETKTITALDDFIFNVELNSTVSYIKDTLSNGTYATSNAITFIFNPDNNTTNSTNIKMIKVSATANGIENPISMYAFSSNIGQSKVTKKTW
jgi:type II secretory pathway pseudopilin PulG